MANNDDEPTTSHLLAHGQNRNQYTGSEPTSWQETHDCPCLHLDHACVGSDCDTCRGFNHANWPTTPKPQQPSLAEILAVLEPFFQEIPELAEYDPDTDGSYYYYLDSGYWDKRNSINYDTVLAAARLYHKLRGVRDANAR